MYYKLFSKIFKMVSEKMCFEIQDFISQKEKVLDLGCGSGIFAQKLKEKVGAEIVGIDIVDKRVFQIPFFLFDGKKIPFPDDFFDTVLISFVLHHTENPITILKEAKRVGKQIIIFEDLINHPLAKIRCFFHWLVWNLNSKNGFSRFNFFSEKKWEDIFKNLNLKLISKKDFLPTLQFIEPVKRKIFILEKRA